MTPLDLVTEEASLYDKKTKFLYGAIGGSLSGWALIMIITAVAVYLKRRCVMGYEHDKHLAPSLFYLTIDWNVID